MSFAVNLQSLSCVPGDTRSWEPVCISLDGDCRFVEEVAVFWAEVLRFQASSFRFPVEILNQHSGPGRFLHLSKLNLRIIRERREGRGRGPDGACPALWEDALRGKGVCPASQTQRQDAGALPSGVPAPPACLAVPPGRGHPLPPARTPVAVQSARVPPKACRFVQILALVPDVKEESMSCFCS